MTRTTRAAYKKKTNTVKKKTTTSLTPHQSKLASLKKAAISRARAKHTKRAEVPGMGEHLVEERMFEGFEDLEEDLQ